MRLIIKAKRMPIGTVSHGRKKIAESRWVGIAAEASGFSMDMINKLRKEWGKLTTVNPESPVYKKLVNLLDSLDVNRLKQLARANIKFVSLLAKIRASKLGGGTVGGGASYARPILQPVFKSIVLIPTIVKAKYTRRWKGKDGKWNYEYGKPQGKEERFTGDMLEKLRLQWGGVKGVDPAGSSYKALTDMLDTLDADKLKQLVDARIKFVSPLARNRLSRMKSSVTKLPDGSGAFVATIGTATK